MSTTRLTRVVALAATAALTTLTFAATAAPTSAARPQADPSGKYAASTADQKAAELALAKVQAIFAPKSTSQARALVRRQTDATLAMRDLALRQDSLTGADRQAARALFKRPTDAGGDGSVEYTTTEAAPVCSTDICVHSVATTADAATPTFVTQTLDTLTAIHNSYLDSGYREPKDDGTAGGDPRIDVYLADIGPSGLYGYCTTDEPNPAPSPSPTYDRWAYCVLDNDYSTSEFPTNTSLENLQVTVAHEYFHATQYAYDFLEDSWLLEATATWVEDEMYDDVNDNLQYLATSPLTKPRVPLDTFAGSGPNTGFHYGTWSFIRFLTEKFTTKEGDLPKLVLDIFEVADGAAGGPDQYSWQAVDSVLKARGTTVAKMFAAYAVANLRPGTSYSEGQANHYPAAPLAATISLDPRHTSTTTAKIKLDHLTSATYRFVPKNLNNKLTKLRITLDMAPTTRGSLALISVTDKAGKVTVTTAKLSGQGDAKPVVKFSTKTVRYVEVTLVNASGTFTCFNRGDYSCQGTSNDDNVLQKISGRAFI